MKEKMQVVAVENDMAILRIFEEEETCKTCPLEIICKEDKGEETIRVALNGLQVKPGDIVLITAPKASVTKLSFFMYALPLIMFITSILMFKRFSFSDELSFLYSVVILAIYYLILRFLDKKLAKKFAPKVVKVLEHKLSMSIK